MIFGRNRINRGVNWFMRRKRFDKVFSNFSRKSRKRIWKSLDTTVFGKNRF